MIQDYDQDGFVLEEATIAEIHRAMQRGILTCRSLVKMYLKRIAAFDQKGPALNAVILLNPMALEIADEMDVAFKQKGFVGPLHGIPLLLKDNIDTGDMDTTGGSLSLKGFRPDNDAFITKKLKAAGALILAKVNLHEFAIWGETASSILGQTLNPYDLTRTPGGSSGGTGAGLAANFGTVGIGTDTINSIRSPASACSLVGLRPTIGLISREGIIPYSLTQDTAGPIARTVEDAVMVLDVIAGYDPDDAATDWSVGKVPDTYRKYLDPQGLQAKRIGVLRSFFGTGPEHQEVNAAISKSIDAMRAKGAEIVEVKDAIDANQLVSEVSVHLYDLKDHLNSYLSVLGPKAAVHSLSDVIASGKYHPGIEANIKKAETLGTDSPKYRERLIKRAELQTQTMKLMADYKLDALVYPHQKRLVVPVGQTQLDRNGVLGSVTGFPSIVVPGGFSATTVSAPIGVPIGLELLGRPWSEPILIQIAYAFEQATKLRRPPASTPSLS
ncbi:MAG TPA: amidase family protein [Negativicutes bacterium]|nr:amidase family protein [Negativicutes bacterium]